MKHAKPPRAANHTMLERAKWIEQHRVEKTAGCWRWTGRLTDRGYPELTGWGRKLWRTPRFFFIAYRGPISAGLTVDQHMEAVTMQEQVRRRDLARSK